MKMGMFGNALKKFINSDAATFALGGYNGLDRKAAKAQQAQMMEARRGLLGAVSQAYAPQPTSYGSAPGIDGSIEGIDNSQQSAPTQDPRQMILPELLKYAAQYDPGSIKDYIKPTKYDSFNLGGGALGVVDSDTGKPQFHQAPNPYQDVTEEEKKAKVDALIALAEQRRGSGAASRAKAAQPYAPQRPRVGKTAAAKGPIAVVSQSQYMALPSGSTYKAPDGSIRTKR
jgi:hypothetical protein